MAALIPEVFRHLFRWLSLAVVCSFLYACLPEEVVPPDAGPGPVPISLPSLSCKAFIKDGYTGKNSYYPGETVRLFLDTSSPGDLCRLTVFTVNGDSAFSLPSGLPESPRIPADASTNGFGLPVATEFVLPPVASGVYLINRRIPFIVKTREAPDIVIVYPSNTANAYATSGGKSLYSTGDRPVWVSFHRPVPLQAFAEHCLKWFTSLTEFRISYITDKDMDDPESFSGAKVLVLAGHSEYWTRTARMNFDKFVHTGGHALILSGNTMWWQVRYSADGTRLICYRDATADPEPDPLLKTIEWNQPLLDYPILPSIGAHFPNGGYGLKGDDGWDGYKVVAPQSPLFSGLGLEAGQVIRIPSSEYDGAPLAGYDDDGYPVVDQEALGFEKLELLAFDKGYRVSETTATFIVFQKTKTSGIVINTATTDWCSSNGMGGRSSDIIKHITYNALAALVNDGPVFTR